MPNRIDLDGEVAVVTGGGSGIGRATALRLGASGARVAVLDLNGASAVSTASTIEAAGGVALGLACDIARSADVDARFDEVTVRFGEVTTSFAAAGVFGSDAETVLLSDDEWRSTLGVNLDGVFFTVRASLRSMLRGGRGSIVTCGSTGAFTSPGGGIAAYRSSKAAVLALTRTVAVEYAGRGIRANCICPGPITTPLSVPGRVTTPLGRYGEPSEIAGWVAFLASADASFMTGQPIIVDGGMLAG